MSSVNKMKLIDWEIVWWWGGGGCYPPDPAPLYSSCSKNNADVTRLFSTSAISLMLWLKDLPEQCLRHRICAGTQNCSWSCCRKSDPARTSPPSNKTQNRTPNMIHLLFSSVAEPDPGSSAFLTIGSGMGKKSRSGSEIRTGWTSRIILPRA